MQDKCENLQNRIVSYSDAEKIRELLAKESKDTIVVFDASCVLMDSIGSVYTVKRSEAIKKLLDEKVGCERAERLASILTRDSKYKLVEVAIQDLINDLQSRGVKTLALTGCATGKFGVLESMDSFRIEQLQKLNYHFEKSWENLDPKQLSAISSDNYRKNSDISKPSFKDGVICTDRGDKDKVLSEFLKYANFRPKK